MAKGGDTRPVGDFMVEDFDVVANDIEVGSRHPVRVGAYAAG